MPHQLEPHESGPGKSFVQYAFERNCREFMSKEGWETLMRDARAKDFKTHSWAIDRMLGYGFGKPREVIDVSERRTIAVSVDDITRQIVELTAGQATPGGEAVGASPGPQ